MGKKVLLLLVAHADDTEFLAGGTVARFVDEGWEVYEVITTDNARGTFELSSDDMIPLSRIEARGAAQVLGKKDVMFLDYPDGFLSDTPLNVLRERFMRIIRRLKPRAVMTFDPWAPFETHQDHRQVALAAVEACSFAHMPLFHPEHLDDGLPPHLVAEQYLFAKQPEHVNKIIDITDYIDKKIDALCCHDSQMKLTIDDLKMSLQASGAEQEVLGLLDRDNYRPGIEMMLKAHCAEIGKKAGFEYGEQFRHEVAGGVIAAAVAGMANSGE